MNVTPATPPAPLAPPDRARAAHLRGAALHGAQAAEQRAAVAAQFEAIQLLGPTLTKAAGTGDGASAAVYGDLLTEALANQLTAGRGLGLGRMIEQQLTPRGLVVAADKHAVASAAAPR
jgi:peptidoglycan hydrolase FlgJ